MSRWRLELARRSPRVAVAMDAVGHAWSGREALAAASRVDVIAAHDVAVLWLQAPPRGVRSLEELRRVAATRCAHLHGGEAQDWWVAGAWDAGRPFVCCALPRPAVEAMRAMLGAGADQARWHTSWGLIGQGAATVFPSQGWCALHSPGRVVFWHCRQGRIDALGSLACNPQESAQQTAARVVEQARIEALREALPPPDAWTWASLVSEAEGVAGPWHVVRIPGVQPVTRTASEAQAALALLPLLEAATA